jgi:nonsense-mediated mRNA decay protein 3
VAPETADAPAFCVVCGTEEGPFEGPLCVRCFGQQSALLSLPGRISRVFCPMCGARQVGRHWELGNPPGTLTGGDLARELQVRPGVNVLGVRWTEVTEDPLLRRLTASATLELKGTRWETECSTEVHVVYHVCPECSRRQGHFYTAQVQLRASEAGSLRTGAELRAWVHRQWETHLKGASESVRKAVSFEQELKEGWDIFFSSTPEARAASRAFRERFGASYLESASLYSRKGGEDIYRVTFLLRLPPAGPGDYLEREDRLYRIHHVDPRGPVEMIDAQYGAKQVIPLGELVHARLVCGPEGVSTQVVHFPPEGPPFVRPGDGSREISLRGRLPDRPTGGGVGELPVALGARQAWWLPARSLPRAARAPGLER